MTSPHDVVRVGILGAGYIAEAHLHALSTLHGVQVVAVCDRAASRAAQLADAVGATAYTDLDEMLRDASLDVVHNLTPPDVHAASCRQLLEAGVDVLVEKPFAPTSAECRSLVALAGDRGALIGVSHSSIHADAYLRLRRDVEAGRLGELDHVHATWRTDFGQLETGDTDAWMFRSPEHIVAEIGPHPLSHVLDLLGTPDEVGARAAHPTTLRHGGQFHRLWQLHGSAGDAGFDVTLEFRPGVAQELVVVHGALASATVDLVRNTYVRHHSRPGQFDVERMTTTVADAAATVRDSISTLGRIVATKAGRSAFGNPFHASVAGAVRAFYDGRAAGELPRGVDPLFGTDILDTVERAVASAGVTPYRAPVRLTERRPPSGPVDALVIGGTGFIGRHLVEALVADGQSVRVIGRSATKLSVFDGQPVQQLVGSIGNLADLHLAVAGARTVFHLAMGDGSSWEQWQASEVQPALDVAAACLDAGVERLVYASSIAIFDYHRDEPITNDTEASEAVTARNHYARAKAEAERRLLRMNAEDGLAVVIARPGIVVGAGGPVRHGGLANWAGSAVQLVGRGDHPLPLVLATDVATALVQCARLDGIVGAAFNLVGDVRLTANEYLDAVEAAAGVTFDRSRRPAPWVWLAEAAKWAVKVGVRHHNRTPPSYAHVASASFARPFDTRATKRELRWHPEADRAAFVKAAIEDAVDHRF